MVERAKAEIAADQADYEGAQKKRRSKRGTWNQPSEEARQRLDAQETVVRCTRCKFKAKGTLGETRQAFTAHACPGGAASVAA
jgi:hypothetical protein